MSLSLCKANSGGIQCERTDPHESGHSISEHTIVHALMGNGYSCAAVQAEVEMGTPE